VVTSVAARDTMDSPEIDMSVHGETATTAAGSAAEAAFSARAVPSASPPPDESPAMTTWAAPYPVASSQRYTVRLSSTWAGCRCSGVSR
jgi:hypothetical protein